MLYIVRASFPKARLSQSFGDAIESQRRWINILWPTLRKLGVGQPGDQQALKKGARGRPRQAVRECSQHVPGLFMNEVPQIRRATLVKWNFK